MGNDDTVTDIQIRQLTAALTELKANMKEGFAEIKRLLDERFASRDERFDAQESRLRATELIADRNLQDVKELKRENAAMRDRLAKVEKWVWQASAIAAVAASVLSIIVGKL